MKKTMLILLVAALGCDNKPGSTTPTKAGDTKAGTKGDTKEPPQYKGDPEGGDFTLDEATAGLAGDAKAKLIAKIKTSKGDIECELLPDIAPLTVASFVGLARGLRAWQEPGTETWVKKPFFDGLAFHRVKGGFMIQGGDPLSRNYSPSPQIGTGGPGYRLKAEFTDKVLFDKPGILAMARGGGDVNSAGSQFFITDGAARSLDRQYTIFGRCGNPDVVKAITGVQLGPPTEPDGSPNRPVDPITMTVEIFRR